MLQGRMQQGVAAPRILFTALVIERKDAYKRSWDSRTKEGEIAWGKTYMGIWE